VLGSGFVGSILAWSREQGAGSILAGSEEQGAWSVLARSLEQGPWSILAWSTELRAGRKKLKSRSAELGEKAVIPVC